MNRKPSNDDDDYYYYILLNHICTQMLTIYLPYITLTNATGKDGNGISLYQVKVQPPIIIKNNVLFCPGITLDPLGHHAASCRHDGDVVSQHNNLRDIFADICRRAHLSVKVEVGYGLSREHFNSRPADVLVQSWDRGKPAAFDVTVASPLTPATLNEAGVSAGAAAHVAENRKHAANDTKCQELGWSCIPLAVETYGNWGKEAQYVFSRLASLLAVGQSSPKPKMVAEIYGRLNLSLVRSVARAIMGREMAHG